MEEEFFLQLSSSKRMSVASSDTRRIMPVISTSEWIWGGDGSRGKLNILQNALQNFLQIHKTMTIPDAKK